MTNHEQLETMLRSSLTERAGDVDTTPALYERVQRQATRGTWLRRGVALAGAAAVVAVAVTVVPALVPDQPLRPDVAESPDLIEPTEPVEPSVDPSVDEDTKPGVPAAALSGKDLAYATDDGIGGSWVDVGERVVHSDVPVISLAASPVEGGGDDVAAGRQDGSIGVIDGVIDGDGNSGESFDLVVDASANGGGVVFSPDGDAIAWIEGTDLHVLPAADDAQERVLPLEGDVPANLRIEQWFYASDAQVILASEPSGGVWSIPMDDSNSYNSAPTAPAFVQDAARNASDAALLSDLSLARLEIGTDGAQSFLTIAGTTQAVDGLVSGSSASMTASGTRVVLHDAATGRGAAYRLDGDGSVHTDQEWDEPGVTAVVPMPTLPAGVDAPSEDVAADPTSDDAAALGLPTDAPVVGTSGTDLLVRTADGQVQTIAVYEQPSEATLGRLAVRPGSTLDAGLVAVESFSEGENSIRLVALRDGGASPVGDVLIADGPVTGLVWSEDGKRIAWTDTAGLHESPLSDSGGLGGELLATDTGPVLDWVWTQMDGVAAAGYFAIGVNGVTGVELLGIERASDETVTLTGSVGGADRVVLSTHANPGAAVGPEVIAQLGGGGAELTWSADGDRSGQLPDPGQLGGDVRVQVSGGQVLVMGDSRQALVTFDGQVLDLPTAADWDVLD